MIGEGQDYETKGDQGTGKMLVQGDGGIPARGTDTVIGLSKFTVS